MKTLQQGSIGILACAPFFGERQRDANLSRDMSCYTII